jgi:hypothetical protein
MHCNHSRIIVLNPALVPPSSPEALHVSRRERPLLAKEGIMDEKWPVKFSLTMRLPRHCRVLLHPAKLRHGTDGFTFPPKGGMLRNFSPKKIRRLRPGLIPRSWVPGDRYTYSPMKMEQTGCSEKLAFKIWTPGNHPEESTRHSRQGER